MNVKTTVRRIKWQNIRSAPKDNTGILVWCPNNMCSYHVYWDTPSNTGWYLFGPMDKILLNSYVSESLSLWTHIPTPQTPFESVVEGLTDEEKGIAKGIVELLFRTRKKQIIPHIS